MYASPNETLAALERVGYFTDLKTATTVYLAGRLHRPVLLEGPAGAGKTELAASVSRAYRVPLLRLQCYQGINEEKAIGQYDKSLQELYVLLMSKSDQTPDCGNQTGGDKPRVFHRRPIARSNRAEPALCPADR
ncbi:MAG TPA: AAA family ATPase [Edaphobacter sp.]